MKNTINKFKLNFLGILFLGILFNSCNQDVESVAGEENYENLFPWQGIDKPESAYEDMEVKTCDTEQILSNYSYFGKDIPNKRSYIVTVECSFIESPFEVGSRYVFRYIDDKKELKSIGTKVTQDDISEVIESGFVYKKTFKVESGYPMYLFVNGGGNRSSSVKAKITAESEDGLIVVPILSTEQYQNKMGFDRLEKPYCEYIILP